MSKKGKALIIVAAALFLALVGTVAYFLAYYRLVGMPTPSMANTIIPGDSVLCATGVGEIKRGDIVIFKLREDPKVMYMKRVIGLPGETIQVKRRRVFINDGELPEERALVRLTGPQDPVLPVVKLESKPQDARYCVFYDIERPFDGDEFDPAQIAKYGVAEQYRIPQGHYFMLGDSRDNSMDSRHWGTVSRELIVGKAMMIVGSKTKGNEERLFKPLK